jgi:hypothetical protein
LIFFNEGEKTMTETDIKNLLEELEKLEGEELEECGVCSACHEYRSGGFNT